MTSELDGTIATRLRAAGHRYSASRRALVDHLRHGGRPLSIVELLEAGPGQAQSSVYRNLAVLEQSGVVRRLVTHDDYARFELAEDLTEHHHHLICTSCGVVTDVILPAKLERSLEDACGEISRAHAFAVDHHQLDLLGRCGACTD
jgi:Fur family transcriptional regulator, ferric uptake regulator